MDRDHRFKVAKIASFVNALTNTLLSLFKIVVGIFGHSTALIADGIHSFSDVITDMLVLVASKAGAKHPDASHPYGHQRIETFAAIIISLVFLSAGIVIIYEAIIHLIHRPSLQTPSLAVIIVAAASVVANEWLFRYTLKKGKSVNSDLLISNAWHNRGDAYVSLVVLISAGIAWLGIHYFDAIGALIIALFILKTGSQLIWKSINELIDAAVDEETLLKIKNFIITVPGVTSIHQLRTRLHGGNIFVDVHIQVDPMISVSEGHYISEQVHLSLIRNFDHISDVTVHIDPENDETSMPSINLPSRPEILEKLNKQWTLLPANDAIQKISLHYLNGKLTLEIFLSLQSIVPSSPDEITALYESSIREIPEIKNLHIHFTKG